jgi:hypothetical protein
MVYVHGEKLHYAIRDEIGWHIETIDQRPTGGSHDFFMYVSIVLNDGGNPLVSYVHYDGTGETTVKFAQKDAGGWHLSDVITVVSANSTAEIALDSSSYPHLAFAHGDAGVPTKVEHLYKDAAGWQSATVAEGTEPTVSIDSVGEIHIAYLAYNGTADAWLATQQHVTLPSIPMLLAPDNDAVLDNTRPTFEWDSQVGINFNIQVNETDDFSSPIIDEFVNVDSYTPLSNLMDSDHFWRVRAKDSTGDWSGWSNVWQFSVNTTSPVFNTYLPTVSISR